MPLSNFDSFTIMVFVLLFSLAAVTYGGASSIAENPFVWGAHLFFKPVNIAIDSILQSGFFWLMPVAIIFLFVYLRFLGNFLGEGLAQYITIAVIIMLFASYGL